ncbi:MAG TPA: protein phosphatase 2C domain-containing protein [Acidimicrobiales bacterium]|nr:protein phosphatase 2C domain-containing protein [Acidimicrobiales bacterium]
MDDLMPIGEFSDRSGLSPKRLRSYAAGGLLVPAAVDSASGYRYYSPGQLREAQLIDALREAGMPLADIGSILREPSAEQLDAWARRVEIDAAQRQDALELARRLLAIEVTSLESIGHERAGGASMRKLKTASCMDVGRVRDNNEDAVVSGDFLAAVADGMGGHPGGEVASAIAVALVPAVFTGKSLDELQAAVRAANRAIWDRAEGSSEFQGMGTTICAVGLTEDGELAVVNVGDSRAYVWRDGTLSQLSQDHSMTAELVRRGEISEQEALVHPHRSVLTRALGIGPDVEPYSAASPAVEGDRVLVCTDGLFNEVPDDVIASVMADCDEVQVTADALVALALSGGGRDNVSVVVAEVCL